MKYLFFFVLFLSCNPSTAVLKGSCQLGESKTFEAPNGEFITATVDTVGKLQLTGNLNLTAESIKIETELRDTVFEEWEARPLMRNPNLEYQILLEVEGAKRFGFEVVYIEE